MSKKDLLGAIGELIREYPADPSTLPHDHPLWELIDVREGRVDLEDASPGAWVLLERLAADYERRQAYLHAITWRG